MTHLSHFQYLSQRARHITLQWCVHTNVHSSSVPKSYVLQTPSMTSNRWRMCCAHLMECYSLTKKGKIKIFVGKCAHLENTRLREINQAQKLKYHRGLLIWVRKSENKDNGKGRLEGDKWAYVLQVGREFNTTYIRKGEGKEMMWNPDINSLQSNELNEHQHCKSHMWDKISIININITGERRLRREEREAEEKSKGV